MDDPYSLMFARPEGPWFKWFAWHPVSTVDRGWVWLRWVWRRRVAVKSLLEGPSSPWFQSVVDVKWEGDQDARDNRSI